MSITLSNNGHCGALLFLLNLTNGVLMFLSGPTTILNMFTETCVTTNSDGSTSTETYEYFEPVFEVTTEDLDNGWDDGIPF